ncbi:MAG: urate hydroxylase PuuD [Pseudomonadota bacterium]|nr:urate hydroxylase PuuD [Pseudomonadota bacterium]
MLGYLGDWLNLLVRWAHLVVGIGWIGTSFYFIWLDLALRRRERMNPGVLGTAWLVHGGGFYNVEKYTVAPPELPPDLHWFKWEAYLTWVTGFLLLILQYYLNARAYLIDPSVLALAPWQAVLISVASLAAGWAAYDGICRSRLGDSPAALAVTVFVLIVLAALLYTNVFSGRGALIHVGALIGTIMSANVFMVIIPNQRRMIAVMMRGEAPDPKYGKIGKQRSVHNNYLTLPVLVLMVSNHYPMLYAHRHGWLVVALILVAGGMARHFINRHDAGEPLARIAWTLPAAAAALVAAVVVTAPRTGGAAAAASDQEVMRIVSTHCMTCHSSKPTHESFREAPKDVRLDDLEQVRAHKQQVLAQAVLSEVMPLGNETGMTEEERRKLGAWLNSR